MHPKFFTTALILATCLFAFPVNAADKADDPIVELPFAFEAGHVIVAAKIKKDVPVEFILATGAQYSSFDFALLQKYKLPAYYAGVGVITGHNDQTITFTTVPDLRIGDAQESSLNMRFVSLGELSKKLGREIAGILGADFFKGRTVQFDFMHKRLRFLPKSEANLVAKSSGPTNRSVLAMSDRTDRSVIPVVEAVMINHRKFKTLFDTGAVTVVSLSTSAAKQLGLAAPPEKGPPLPDKIASLLLAESEEIPDVPVLVFAKGSNFDPDQLGFGAIVGTVLLQNFRVTFDFRGRVIILER